MFLFATSISVLSDTTRLLSPSTSTTYILITYIGQTISSPYPFGLRRFALPYKEFRLICTLLGYSYSTISIKLRLNTIRSIVV